MSEEDAAIDATRKLSKTVSVKMPNVRDGKSHVLEIALEPDETTLKVSIAGNQGCEIHVRAADLIEAVRLFGVAVGTTLVPVARK